MKQLVQDFKTGDIKLVEVPAPVIAPGRLLVGNAFSLVSAGTERATVSLGQQSLVGKARSRPDLVKQVLNTVKREGVAATVRKVQARLDQWKMLGYSMAGTVLEIGEGVTGFSVGDRVACAGQDYACHAEVVCVPQNLCARIPAGVEFQEAAFTTLGSIAMQGVRQAETRLGETVAIIGLGLVGQLTMQLVKAAGGRVLGIDLSEAACELAKRCGCDETAIIPRDDVERIAARMTNEFGVDAVIITASTETNEPIQLAAETCRDRGRVVMVGVTGMEVPRDLFYHKELDFRFSRSYGPGRYDPLYEEQGLDYPIGYVRWTEQRNMEAFLQLLASKRIAVAPLVTHTFAIADAPKAYQLITGKTGERSVGVLLKYDQRDSRPQSMETSAPTGAALASPVVLGVIGAGNHAQGVLLPQFKANPDVALRAVCTATGAKAQKAKEKFGFQACTTDWHEIVSDPAVNTVVIATRHDLHATIVGEALRAGKSVFCEKPLCLREDELEEIVRTTEETKNTRLMVGFNRRFAPFAAKTREMATPLVMRYRVSVGPLPHGHWAADPEIGGGRILGEVCHFVDFLQSTARAKPVRVFAQGFGGDNVQVAVRFADGSVGSIDYFDVADPSLGKEQFEVFGDGKHLVVNEFRDKGQAEEVRQFVQAVKTGGPMPIALDQIVASTRATFAILRSLQTGQAIEI
ncbi:MAG TPA: bi-domain-containing oxidoreductase [Verrucomicrobiae bacterium]|nr:bi-domain-containing oxidoreductase [Verrucomicrobiae bacterium]